MRGNRCLYLEPNLLLSYISTQILWKQQTEQIILSTPQHCGSKARSMMRMLMSPQDERIGATRLTICCLFLVPIIHIVTLIPRPASRRIRGLQSAVL